MRKKLFVCDDYEVDSNGVVYSKRGKPLKPSINHSGYQIINIMVNGRRVGLAVHTAVLSSFEPKPFETAQINHKDGNKTNNRLENLEWCTAAENTHHAFTVLRVDPQKDRKKPVKAVNVDTGKVIIFPSLTETAKALKCTKGVEVY